jgi:putative oxidoreductase
MSIRDLVLAPSIFAARLFNPLQSLVALAARLYVSWQFWNAGYIKVSNWQSTLYLFENEYHTPYLSPQTAAIAGTFGELFFPTLLVLGLFGRLSAVGLFCVNAVAVISYSQVLLADGSEAALAQHILWGTLLLFIIVYGPGKMSTDHLLMRSRL